MLIRSFRHRGINVHFHDFEETKHPRAKTGKSAGQFVKKGEEGKSNETVHGPGSTGQPAQEQSRPDQGRSTGGSGGNGVRSDGLDIKSTYRPKGDTDEHHVFHEVEVSHHAARKYCNYITKAKNSSKYGAAVHVYEPEDYAKMRLFLNPDASAGFALKGDDIISVFKDKTGPLGACRAILDIATEQGGRRLDCFDTVLPAMYNQSGFQAVARMPFNDEYKPEGWDYDTFGKYKGGRPDVVFMVYDPDNKKMYSPGDGETITDYDDGEKYQKQALTKDAFKEEEHKRDEGGKFAVGGEGGNFHQLEPEHRKHLNEVGEIANRYGYKNLPTTENASHAMWTRGEPTENNEERHILRAYTKHDWEVDEVKGKPFWFNQQGAGTSGMGAGRQGLEAHLRELHGPQKKTKDVFTRVFKIRDTRVFLHVHDFKEEEHPRAKSGEFTKKGSGESGAAAGPTTTSTGVKPKAAPGAVVVNPIALILKKHGYEKQKGSNIYKHASGHEVEVHAATEGQKWLTGWTHSSGSTGSGAGRLDAHLESISHSKPKTPPPKPEAEKPKPPPPKPEAEKEKEKPATPPPVKTSSGAKPPSGSAEDNKAREKHQKRIDAIVAEGGYINQMAHSPAKLKKMLTEVTSVIYDYMGVDPKIVTFSVGRTRMFNIGGKKFRAGGYYTPLNNHLVIGTNNSPKRVGGLASHEIMHAKYDAVKKAYVEEEKRLGADTRDVMRPDGRIREPYQADYPVHTVRPDGFVGSYPDLEKDDGVTEYSTDYWIAAKKGTAKKELAINETLAEMANLDWKGQLSTLDWFKKSTTYKPLYEAIHKLYPVVTAGSKPKPATLSPYPTSIPVLLKAGFDRAYTRHGQTVVGYGKGFTAVINRTTNKWKSNHGTGEDYDSLLKALEKYKNDTKHLEKYK